MNRKTIYLILSIVYLIMEAVLIGFGLFADKPSCTILAFFLTVAYWIIITYSIFFDDSNNFNWK